MQHSLVPTGLTADNEFISFRGLHSSFKNTPYGNTLKNNIRFAPFKPDSVSREEWCAILGPDVNNLDHLLLTYGMTRCFLHACVRQPDCWKKDIPADATFAQEEQETMLLAATTHDWGEAVIGDIAYSTKTSEDEKRELVVLREIMEELFGEKNELKEKMHSAIHQVVAKKRSDLHGAVPPKLAHAFEAIEELGYLRTGIRAWNRSALMGDDQEELKRNLRLLGTETHLFHLGPLMEFSELYPFIHHFLHQSRERISRIIESIPDDPFAEHDTAQAASLVKKMGDPPARLIQTRARWDSWKQSL